MKVIIKLRANRNQELSAGRREYSRRRKQHMQRPCGVRKKSGPKELKTAVDGKRANSVYQGSEGARVSVSNVRATGNEERLMKEGGGEGS